MTPLFITALVMATSVNADLFPGGLFPNGLFPNGLFPNGLFPNGLNMPKINIPPIPQIVIPPIPPITIPPIKIPTAEDIANLKPRPGQNYNGVSINTVNGVTTVVVNKDGVVKKYEFDPNSPDANTQQNSVSSSNNVVTSYSNSPNGYNYQSSMTYVGGNGGGVANLVQNIDGEVTHEIMDFNN